MESTHQKPGMLLVHPRLIHKGGLYSSEFCRWTKLHFRDMLKMSSDKHSDGKVTSCLRFIRSNEGQGYGHDPEGDTKPMFVYSKAYDDLSRVLNLENTRELNQDEYPVNYSGNLGNEATVFDIVSARFAVYEDISLGREESFQDLPRDLLSPSGAKHETLSTYLIAVNVGLDKDAREEMVRISWMLWGTLRKFLPAFIKTYPSLYRWKGKEAQPKDHPLTDAEKNAGWMLMICVSGVTDPISDTAEGFPKAKLEQAVKWLGVTVDCKLGEMLGYDVPRSYGMWEGDVLMR
ncbi:hypothetical protein J3E71DRAFT_399217 [Bipolaris maydis]|nr:hypothetical protein J3E73DRAFT_423149 [Bipolaris maydis]KAJ6282839.1 hypothetical protein J3E71DRAFT_399217 [Bipolaris maydis]